MNVLFITSEVTPWSKTGGLADVAAALPRALVKRGHEVTVVSPRYAQVPKEVLTPLTERFTLDFPFGSVDGQFFVDARVGEPNWLFVEQPLFFGRPGIYGERGESYGDNARRFAFLTMAGLYAAQRLMRPPDIIHLNDWQTGLGALALKRRFRTGGLARTRSVFTAHNLAYHGNFPKSAAMELGISFSDFTTEGVEFYDELSFLKAGLVFADAVTTVSPRYAEEIATPTGGFGMDGVIRARPDGVTGILNGVDTDAWDPSKDVYLPQPFTRDDLRGKHACARALLARTKLKDTETGRRPPIFASVTRLVEQKGIDLIAGAVPTLVEQGARVVILGNGKPAEEAALKRIEARYPGLVSVTLGFDVGLSHLIEAGADFFLMPSRYEPCGLNQMYSLRYGTVPIVRAVGGLYDSVVDLAEPGGTGIRFTQPTAEDFHRALERAFALFRNPNELALVQKRGMAVDVSWERAVEQYERLYLRTMSTAA